MPSENDFNLFLCRLCADAEPMDAKTFKTHRETVHQLTSHGGRKRMTMHMDARDWHETAYECLNADDDTVFALQTTRVPRRKDDLLYDMGPDQRGSGKRGKR